MKINNLIYYFLAITILALLGLVYSFYNNYIFDNNDLSYEIKTRIAQKESQIITLIKKHYNIDFKAPIVVSEKIGTKRFGMATFDSSNGEIKIYLSKSRFKESANYMIEDVLPHEYAHALMFRLNHFPKQKAGHSKLWQETCINLGGKRCDRFVNHDDVLIDKTNFFK